MSVRRLLGEMDSREITEWMAYEMVEPFGPWREDVRAGVIASTIANVNRGKSSKPFKPTDFVLEFGKQRKPVDDTALMMAQMQMFAAVQNATVSDESGTPAAESDNPEPERDG
jgi:hypothetical protein